MWVRVCLTYGRIKKNNATLAPPGSVYYRLSTVQHTWYCPQTTIPSREHVRVCRTDSTRKVYSLIIIKQEIIARSQTRMCQSRVVPC